MIKLHRGPAPDVWTRENVKRWTGQWLVKDCDSRRWTWPQIKGRRLNQYAQEALDPWHHGKCAFCETPFFSGKEIEHYRSKTHYPLSAFVWRNLFLICRDCNQNKGEKEHQGSLKPDRENPEDYLWVNPTSLKIEPRPGISEEAEQRALNTIALYKLDRPELSDLYKRYWLLQTTSGVGLEILRSVANQQDIAPEMLRAKLTALMDASQPFSLMTKSLLNHITA
jgi:uncharacterized protein (TIGR02646 family)